jgi:F-type H+-transporting ATPase subunit b
LKYFSGKARFCTRFFFGVLVAALAFAPVIVPVKAHAQENTAPQHEAAAQTAAAPEKPSQEEQEQAFLNAPIVHKIADLLHIPEPAARVGLLLLNFAIIFFAIAIPLSKTMPKVFRRRSQNLSHDLDVARKASEEARLRMAAVEEKLAGLDREVAAFRAQVEQESLDDEKRIKASLEEERTRIVASAEQEINAAAAHARRSLKSFAADLAIETASRQLNLTPETDRALIGEFIGQVSQQGGKK